MSGILNREIVYEVKEQGGLTSYRRFCWNRVNTSQGGGWEPQAIEHQLHNIPAHSNSVNEDVYLHDMHNRVDKIALDGNYGSPHLFDEKKQGNNRVFLVGGNLVHDLKHSLFAHRGNRISGQ